MDTRFADELFSQFQYTSNLMRRYLYQAKRRAGEGDFQQGQGRLMRLLAEEAQLSHKELAEKMRIRPASLSELLRKLEKKGYVDKEQNPNDKRVVFYRLTAAGKAAARRLEEVKQAHGREIFRQLNPGEAQTLLALLEKVAHSLEARTE